MKNILFFSTSFIALTFLACQSSKSNADASGIFEAQEVIISAEANGVLRQFNVSEGQQLNANQEVGMIDCDQLSLQKDQIVATEQALSLRKAESAPQTRIFEEQIALQEKQIATQQEQLRVLNIEKNRLQKLVAAQAAPAKQLDDVNGQVAVTERQIAAAKAQIDVLRRQISSQEQSTAIANRGLMSETQPLGVRKAQLDDQIKRCKVINPIQGTVLSKYAEAHEMATIGKALYKIANLSQLTLRTYVNGEQLALLKIGQPVQVQINQGSEYAKTYTGTIRSIADKAEFTPKTIQTKDERANLVYAVKIDVPNDGLLKIGMYADVLFNQ
jgi:HlyD family secretion protein